MEYLIIIVGIILIVVGFAGCFLPVIPGPPLAYLSLIALLFSDNFEVNSTTLIILGIIVLLITGFDYVIPIVGTKLFGGSKYGSTGSTIGLVVGLFAGPFGIILGPFIGAFVGELIGGKDIKQSFKSGLGSFIGFLAGTLGKVLITSAILIYFIKYIFPFVSDLF